MTIEVKDDFTFLSELYLADCPESTLLAEYPSSNSDDTIFQNKTHYIIHDPYPPPRRELLKCLGPHHLMCCWGQHINVTSEIAPPTLLLDHWESIFGEAGRPNWVEYDSTESFITLFPHQSISPSNQLIPPDVNYVLHSKEIIEQIDCNQASVLDFIQYPCVAKLSHGYAALGNFFIRSDADEKAMRAQLDREWPGVKLIINSVIEDVVSDDGVQFYLQKDGTIVWVGLTQQKFNESNRWCGGTYSHHLQKKMIDPFEPIIEATANLLHQRGYFGLVGVDILTTENGDCFLVDVNPRLTGITPFLMASRIFARRRGLTEGTYLASFRFNGSLEALLDVCSTLDNCQAMVLSAVEESNRDAVETICHLSVSSKSLIQNREVIQQLESYGI